MSHTPDFLNIKNSSCGPGYMGDGNQACARCYQVRNCFEGRAIGVGIQVGKTDNYAETVTKLVQRGEQAGMLVIGSDDLVSLMPVDTIADDI